MLETLEIKKIVIKNAGFVKFVVYYFLKMEETYALPWRSTGFQENVGTQKLDHRILPEIITGSLRQQACLLINSFLKKMLN